MGIDGYAHLQKGEKDDIIMGGTFAADEISEKPEAVGK